MHHIWTFSNVHTGPVQNKQYFTYTYKQDMQYKVSQWLVCDDQSKQSLLTTVISETQ